MLEDVIKKYNIEEDEIDYYSFDGFGPDKPWKHHVVQNPKALVEYIESLGIIGATITDIMLRYGEIYDLGTINRIYSALELEEFSCYQEPIILGIDVDTPIALVTDRGVFEFEFGDASTVMFSVKGLEEKVEPRPLESFDDFEFDISKIFKDTIGRKIVGVEVRNSEWAEVYLDFTGLFGYPISNEQDAYIKSFALKLDNGYALSANAFIDFCELYLVDPNGRNLTMSPAILKDMLVIK